MSGVATLASEVGVSERTLRRAISQGTIMASRSTPRATHVPMAERHYVRTTWPLLAALRATLRTESNVRLALLFGSAARGTATELSDVDVLVDLSDASLDRMIALEEKLSSASGRRVDLVRLQDAEAAPSLLADAIGEGRVLVDRDSQWTRLLRREPVLAREGAEVEAANAKATLERIDRLYGS